MILKRRVNGPISANFLIYVEYEVICGTETAKFTGCFYLEHILDTFGHFIGIIRIGK